MTVDVAIAPDDPGAPEVRSVLETHLAFAREHTPPDDVHALDVADLLADDVSFFTAGREGAVVAVGALQRLDDSHAEIKSMHTVADARGSGVGRAMLEHLMEVAAAGGCTRVSLETGTMAAFAPARSLYESAGFAECSPFSDYPGGPNSVCMTRTLRT